VADPGTPTQPLPGPSAGRRPNILLINCDDLGYGDLGCSGSPVNRTPFLNHLAATGMRLTDFTMASPVCSPSRGAMLTGKWHCRDQPGFLPTDHGFDRFFGLPYSNEMGRHPGRIGTSRRCPSWRAWTSSRSSPTRRR